MGIRRSFAFTQRPPPNQLQAFFGAYWGTFGFSVTNYGAGNVNTKFRYHATSRIGYLFSIFRPVILQNRISLLA